MPQRIPNLEEPIFGQSTSLFSQHDHGAVDMKMVAAAGTSVGNLVNDHPSKPRLLLAIQDHWKHGLVDLFQEVMDSSEPQRGGGEEARGQGPEHRGARPHGRA